MSVEPRLLRIIGSTLKKGYGRFDLGDLNFSPDCQNGLKSLARSALRSPLDPNDSSATRRRRFDCGWSRPESPRLDFFAADIAEDLELQQRYQQPASFNATEAGRSRPFTPLSNEQRLVPGLMDLIQIDAAIARILLNASGAVLRTHLHLIAYVPRQEQVAASSPPYIHRDGEPVTFTHLLSRADVDGGMNAVASLECANLAFDAADPAKILETFTMEHFLESFVVIDNVVSHYVSPVSSKGPAAHRVVLLVDFRPYEAVQ